MQQTHINSPTQGHPLYQGQIELRPATAHSQALCDEVTAYITDALPPESSFTDCDRSISNEEFLAVLSVVRQAIVEDAVIQHHLREVISENGFVLQNTLLDDLRLRGLSRDAHLIPEAEAAFHIHRDTWYANPQEQINWWIPLHDVDSSNTFAFYPDYFNKSVQNTSNHFNYDWWKANAGWQKRAHDDAVYPGTRELSEAASMTQYPMKKGELLLFSGAHLHQTQPNRSERPRFSLDFRTVNKEHMRRGIGAPNVDNNSSGTTIIDFQKA